MTLTAVGKCVLDPAAQRFVDEVEAQAAPPIYTVPVPEARVVLEEVQSNPEFLPAVDQEDLIIPPGVRVKVFRPREAATQGSKLPGILYFHGGGWVLGSESTHAHLIRSLTVATGCAVIYVDYARSPEARFPAAIEECYIALYHLMVSGGKYRIDPERLAVAGDSAGGNLATVVSLLCHVRNHPAPRAQALFYPVTSAAMDSRSYDQFADGPWLTRKAMEWFWNAYLPKDESRSSFEVSPLLAGDSDLAALPETLLITAEADVLRDEGEAYARRLFLAGVPVTSIRYQGMIHDFMMLNRLAGSPAAKHAIQTSADFLRMALTR